jgi:plastocyanin
MRPPRRCESDQSDQCGGFLRSPKEVMVNRIYLLPTFFAFMLATAFTCSAETVNVKMKSLSYDPKELVIHLGDSVTWSNAAFSKHTATSDDDGKTFDTGEIQPDAMSGRVKFEKEGGFKYHCKIHGKSMSGTIVVKPAGTN